MHDRFVSVLSSGSCGNSFLIVDDGTAVLLDAGLSSRELERRLALFGVEPSDVDAVVLTHEHTDHVRGARRFCAEHDVKAYGTRGTLSLTPLDGVLSSPVRAGESFRIGEIVLTPFSVMHLAAEPVAFSVMLGERAVAIASDLGCVTKEVVRHMKGAKLMMVEANYDEAVLMGGGYPEFLKKAINGKNGHLSNADAGLLCSEAATEDTAEVVLVHLSMENNTPELAGKAVEGRLRRSGKKIPLHVSEHGAATGPLRLR